MNKLVVILLFVLFTQIQPQTKLKRIAKPNIIWIVCEDISPFIGSFGYNGVKTPNIDNLAAEGVRYSHVFTTAGVSAPSRSAIITGMYQTSIGTQHMRTIGDPQFQPVPSYSAVIPDYVRCFPEFLREEGYYCTNNEKQDYQFIPPVTVWDENGPSASFLNRPKDKPFFSVYNFFITHESQLFSRHDTLLIDPDEVTVPPIYPDIKTVRHDIARMLTNIERMDTEVGELIDLLKREGLYDNTIIFFYSDHGGVLPWMKREILERGTHIPLIIHFPGDRDAGTVNDDLISAVDFAPTILSLAGVKIPSYIQGKAFLGDQRAKSPRKYVFAARDRMDTEYDRVRMVRSKEFRYLYNYFPEKPYYQDIQYRLSIPMMKDLLNLRDEGKLDSIQMSWFKTKPVEELYNIQNDPFEIHNLAFDSKYSSTLNELRSALKSWTDKVGDMGSLSEKEMISDMWNGKYTPPLTEPPTIVKARDGIRLKSQTRGTSVGYRIIKKGTITENEQHTVQTWDMEFANGIIKNGTKRRAVPVWNLYNGETLKLDMQDTLKINALRIGFKPAIFDYIDGHIIKY